MSLQTNLFEEVPTSVLLDFESYPVRMAMVYGLPHFVARDVATVLGYTNARDAIISRCNGSPVYHAIKTSGGNQNTRVLNKDDVLRLIETSKSNNVAQFKEWFKDILLKQGISIEPPDVQIEQEDDDLSDGKQIVPFGFEGRKIRTITVDNETWVVAKDVALVLGYEWQKGNTIKHVPCEWKGIWKGGDTPPILSRGYPDTLERGGWKQGLFRIAPHLTPLISHKTTHQTVYLSCQKVGCTSS